MKTFVTSDHHFGSWRRFDVLKAFSEDEENILIDKWNSVVQPNDVVLYDGDFHDCNLTELLEYVKRLNGKIILIKGNHDILPDNVYEAMFQDVLDELYIGKYDLLIHHCPTHLKSSKHQIFGHVHRSQFTSDNYDGFCSCVQFNDGYPVSLEKILDILNNKSIRQIADK